MPRERILILGGTREAAALAEQLVGEGHHVVSSLAGRTKEPRPIAGEVRVGGFGGADGLARFVRDGGFNRLIDATHPFAVNITRNAREAAAATGVPFERIERPPWVATSNDHWTDLPSIEAAAAAIPAGSRVLLALGSQHLSPFARRDDVRFVVRMVDAPRAPLSLPDHVVVLGRPSSDPEEEAQLLRRHEIDLIVCRNSGGAGAFAKLEAARALGLPVFLIRRPQL